MTNISDQTTAKVHSFTREFAEKMVKKIRGGTSLTFSEIIMYDIALYRLMEEFNEVDWNDKNKVHHFMEQLLNDAYDIQKKYVKVKMRNLPQK